MQGQQKLKGIHLLVEDLVEIYQQSSEKGNADRDQIFEQLKLLNSCIEDTTSQLWLNQLFIVKPNMASQLIGSLHQFLIKKRSVEAKQEELDALSKIKNHKKRDSVQSELKAMVDDSSAVKAVKKQFQQLFSTISELAQPYRSQSQLASGPSQDIHTINQYSKDVFKTVSQRYFKRNIAILTVAMVGLLVSAATLTVTYLLNMFLMSYFIVSISLMAISLALLVVNGFNMFRAVKKIQRVSESEIVYHEANQRVEEYDDEIFYSISLDDPKAEDGSQERSHQLVSLRLLCLELQAIYAFKASNSTYSQDRLHSISVNEKKIQSYIDALLKSLEADLLNKSWLDHFVKTHPKIISPLLQSMHQVVKKRHQQDIYIHKQLTLSLKGDANYIEALSNTSHEVSTLEKQLGELTSTLNRKFPNNSSNLNFSSIMREIGEKYRKAIKKDHFKYLNKHLLIHTTSVLALFSMTGIVSYLYLTNLKLLLDYLIAWASLAVLSVGVLAIDSIFLVRYLCKIDSENKLKSTFKVDHPMSPIPYKDTGCSKMSVYTF